MPREKDETGPLPQMAQSYCNTIQSVPRHANLTRQSEQNGGEESVAKVRASLQTEVQLSTSLVKPT